MTILKLETFRFRCMNGDVVSVPAADEDTARAIAMERRWGPPQFNRTWNCTEWYGHGLVMVDDQGLPIVSKPVQEMPL